MKKILLLCSLLACSLGVSYAQTTAVTATVVDSDGTTWANGKWSIAWTPGPSNPNINAYTNNGAKLSNSVAYQSGTLNGSGALSVTVYDSSVTFPTGSGWALSVCSNTSAPCSTYNFATAGGSQDISAALTTNIAAPRFKAVSGTYGYADTEATLSIATGATYWNVTSGASRCYSGSAWGACSAGAANAITALTSDVLANGPGSAAATVVKINGATVPINQPCLGSNGSGQPISGTCTGGGGAAVVACTGTNDNVAINAALAAGGNVVVTGNCIVNPVGTNHLTIPSHTHLRTYGATISYNGGTSQTDYVIGNTQVAQTISRTCADVVMTVGSTAITSATCNFSQADVQNDSISCIGGITPGGLAWATAAMGSDLHTTFQNVTNTTTANLADPPSAVSNPMTCNIYTRDQDITIEGGTWVSTSASTQGPSILKLMTVSNLIVRDVVLVDGSRTVPSTGTGFQIYPADLSNFLFENITLGGWNLGNDGIHLLGPARNGTERHIRGHSGDDMLPVFTADGNMSGGSNAQIESRVYGVIDGVLIDDVDGSSYGLEAGVKVSTPTGVSIPVRNLTIRHIHGGSSDCAVGCGTSANNPGFGHGVFLFSGTMSNIRIEDVSGKIFGNDVSVGTISQTTSVSIDTLKLKDLSQQYSAFNGNGLLVGVWNAAFVDNLSIDGMSSQSSVLPTYLNIDPTTQVNQLLVRGSQFAGLTGATAVVPFRLNGTFNSIILDDNQLVFASGNTDPGASASTINMNGARFNRLSIDHMHVLYQAGAVRDGFSLIGIDLYQPGSLVPAGGDIALNDVVLQAPGALTHYFLRSANAAYLNSYTITNSKLVNMAGCVYQAIPISGQLLNVSTSGLSDAGSCVVQSPNVPTAVSTVSLSNVAATTGATAWFTTSSANQQIRVDCTLATGTVSGTGTATPFIFGTAGTFQAGPALTLAANAQETFSAVFFDATAASQFKYQVNYTAGTGGNYNLNCTAIRLQ